MMRTITIGVLSLAALLSFPAIARADHRRARWAVDLGFGWHGGNVSVGIGGCRVPPRPRPVHVHTRTPIYEQIWVPPVHRTVFVGYTRCGRPSYKQVIVQCGYYRTVLVGYRCGDCGVHCN